MDGVGASSPMARCTTRVLASTSVRARTGLVELDERSLSSFEVIPEEDRRIETSELLLTPIDEADAQDAFALLTHPSLTYVAERPRDVEAARQWIARVRNGAENTEDRLVLQWAVRTRGDAALVGLVTSKLTR